MEKLETIQVELLDIASKISQFPRQSVPKVSIYNSMHQEPLRVLRRSSLVAQQRPMSNLSSLRPVSRPASKPVERRRVPTTRPRPVRTYKSRVIPEDSRHDPINYPPQITEQDINDGMLTLVYKGMIPRDADLTPAFQRNLPPLILKPVQLNDWSSRVTPKTGHVHNFDYKHLSPRSERIDIQSVEVKAIGNPEDLYEKKVVVDTGPFDYFPILIKRGKIIDNKDFRAFKEKYKVKWGVIREVLNRIKMHCRNSRIPKLVLDGNKFYDIYIDEVTHFNIRNLNLCTIERENLTKAKILRGVPFRGKHGQHIAAIKIQTRWRTFKASQNYKYFHALNRNARVIQDYFRVYLQKLATKQTISNIKESRYTRNKARQDKLRSEWKDIKNKPRIEIHIGSEAPHPLSRDYYTSQNHFITSVMKATDPLVSVIYVSPTPLHVEMIYYYECMLERCGVPKEKLTLIVPNHGIDIKSRMYTTSTLLNYSFKTINKIKEKIQGEIAYLVTYYYSEEDITIADNLDIPIFTGDLSILSMFRKKSEIAKLFQESGIKVPLTTDVLNADTFYPEFAKLIYDHPETSNWILKTDTDKKSRGMAVVNLNSTFFANFRKKFAKKPHKDIPAIEKELRENLGKMVQFPVPCIWANIEEFLVVFYEKEGFIQSIPEENALHFPVISLLIEPDNTVQYLGAFDKLQSREMLNVGALYPQSSISHSEVLRIARSVSSALFSKGYFGYCSIELISFADSSSGESVIFGLDLTLQLDHFSCAMYTASAFVNGNLDIATGRYFVKYEEDDDNGMVEDVFGDDFTNILTSNTPKVRKEFVPLPTLDDDTSNRPNYEDINQFDERSITLLWHIEHPEIAELSIGAFLHMCRLESAIYNVEIHRGGLFNIYNIPAHKYIGIVAIGGSKKDSVKAMNEMLTFLLTQFGPPPQPTEKAVKPPKEEINFTEIIAKMKATSSYLEKASRKGGFVVNF